MKNLSVQKILTNLQYIRIYIYVAYSRPNGWTEWAETFCGHSWGGCQRLKIDFFSQHLNFFMATLGHSASCKYFLMLIRSG